MPTTTANMISGFKNNLSSQNMLMLTPGKSIQYFTCPQPSTNSTFLKENILLFVVEGNVEVRHGKIDYVVNKNQLAFLRKDILVEYQIGITQPEFSGKNDYIVISLGYELVKEFTRLAELSILAADNILPIIVQNTCPPLLRYIESLGPYFLEPEKVGGSQVKIKLLELLFYLAAHNDNILSQILDLKEHFRSDITNTVEENILNSLSLRQLAVLSGRSLSSFRRDFLAIYNMPPSQWIRQKRLGKARELLASTSMSITDICYTLGFESIAHFSRLFKSQFGYPPSEFRMNIMVA